MHSRYGQKACENVIHEVWIHELHGERRFISFLSRRFPQAANCGELQITRNKGQQLKKINRNFMTQRHERYTRFAPEQSAGCENNLKNLISFMRPATDEAATICCAELRPAQNSVHQIPNIYSLHVGWCPMASTPKILIPKISHSSVHSPTDRPIHTINRRNKRVHTFFSSRAFFVFTFFPVNYRNLLYVSSASCFVIIFDFIICLRTPRTRNTRRSPLESSRPVERPICVPVHSEVMRWFTYMAFLSPIVLAYFPAVSIHFFDVRRILLFLSSCKWKWANSTASRFLLLLRPALSHEKAYSILRTI